MKYVVIYFIFKNWKINVLKIVIIFNVLKNIIFNVRNLETLEFVTIYGESHYFVFKK